MCFPSPQRRAAIVPPYPPRRGQGPRAITVIPPITVLLSHPAAVCGTHTAVRRTGEHGRRVAHIGHRRHGITRRARVLGDARITSRQRTPATSSTAVVAHARSSHVHACHRRVTSTRHQPPPSRRPWHETIHNPWRGVPLSPQKIAEHRRPAVQSRLADV